MQACREEEEKEEKEEKAKVTTIYCDPASTNARKVFEQSSFDLCSTWEEANVIWLRNQYKRFFDLLYPGQALNHIPNECVLAHKGHLAQYLRRNVPEEKSFHPLTFCLYAESECRAFQQYVAVHPAEDLWMLKPPDLSGGKYVTPIKASEGHIERYFGKRYILQRYIEDCYLLHGHKFQFRVFWLLIHTDISRVLLYPQGEIKVSARKFSLTDTVLATHLTNSCQQKGLASEIELRWTFEELSQYLQETSSTNVETLLARTIQILKAICVPIRQQLIWSINRIFFGLFAADFLLDNSLNLWLTELQRGPGLKFSDRVKGQYIPDMLAEIVSLVSQIQQGRMLCPKNFVIVN